MTSFFEILRLQLWSTYESKPVAFPIAETLKLHYSFIASWKSISSLNNYQNFCCFSHWIVWVVWFLFLSCQLAVETKSSKMGEKQMKNWSSRKLNLICLLGKMNPIEAFYADSTVLVTGGTGFLGSVLIEKLLRSFSVKKIFLLIRSKKGLDVEHRMENFINLAIFDLLRTKSPSSFEKIVPVEVDYSKPDLSINLGLLTTIRLEVQVNIRWSFSWLSSFFYIFAQIIFNVVASVKFNEALKDAISINILGTKKVVDMALHLKDLKAFVHVSTIFSNCNRSEIDEKIYSSTMSYQQFIHTGKVYENLKDPNEVEAPVFDNLPNTYTLTKHYAEKLVYHQAFFLPSGIFRPPIVISSYKDFAGYTDNLNGPSGIIVWTVRGYVHCIHGDGSARANLVPVDYCINAMIATAWDIHEKWATQHLACRSKSFSSCYRLSIHLFCSFKQRMQTFSGAPIYNYIFHENNLTWNQLMQLVPLGFHQPLRKSIWRVEFEKFSFATMCSLPFHSSGFILTSSCDPKLSSKCWTSFITLYQPLSWTACVCCSTRREFICDRMRNWRKSW